MIEHNRLSLPGEHAARERVEEIFARLDELGPMSTQLAVPRRDMEEREIALNELEQLADGHGRGELLDEARDRVRDALFAEAGSLFPAAVYAMNPMSTGPVEDRVATISAIEDAVAVAVMEDLLDPRAAALLADPGRQVLGLPPLDLPGRSSSKPRPSAEDEAADAVEDEAEDDDDEAEDDEAQDDDEADAAEARAGLRQRRAALFVIVGVIAIPAAVALGMELPWLLTIAAAVALVAWLFA